MKGGHSEGWCLFSQVAVVSDGALISWEWLNTCLPIGNTERIPSFALLACEAFALSVKLPLSQPNFFPPHYYLSDSLPHPTEVQ